MEIRLLDKDFRKNKDLYKDFLEGKIIEKEEYLSEDVVILDNIPDFPIYMANKNEEERNKEFKRAFKIIEDFYINMDREYILDGRFWYSLFLIYKREYLLEKYPEIKDDESKFKNVSFLF